MRIIVVDTETTGLLLPSIVGLEKQPRIIELGCVVVEEDGSTTDYNWLVNPGNLPLPPEITKITGIKNEDLIDKKTFKEQIDDFRKVFEGCDVMICHNAPFDVGMLKNDIERAGCKDFPLPKQIICSAQEYTSVLGSRPTLKKLYEYIIGEPLAQTHRAIDDAKALFDLLEKDKFFDFLK